MKTLFIVATVGCLFFASTSCKKENENRIEDQTSGNTANDSVSLLQSFGGGKFSYSTDTIPDKLFTPNSSPYTGSYYNDTTYIYYNTNRKVNRLMTIATYGGSMPRQFKVFHLTVFDQGRIAKIYTKASVYENQAEFYDPAYGLNIGSLDPYTNINSYDSLVYDVAGRLIKSYHYNAQNVPSGGGYQFYLRSYDELDYYNPVTNVDSLLYSVKSHGFAGWPSTEIYFTDYEFNRVNPLYKTFKELALFRNVLHIHRFYPPQYIISDNIDRYVTINPYPLKKLYAASTGAGTVWQTYNIINVFDNYNNLISSSSATIYSTGGTLGYIYLRKKK